MTQHHILATPDGTVRSHYARAVAAVQRAEDARAATAVVGMQLLADNRIPAPEFIARFRREDADCAYARAVLRTTPIA